MVAERVKNEIETELAQEHCRSTPATHGRDWYVSCETVRFG